MRKAVMYPTPLQPPAMIATPFIIPCKSAGLSEGVVLWEFEDENMSYSKQNEKMMIQKTSSSVKADLVKT